MRVLLINPWSAGIFPPPSVGYLQAALKHLKVDVQSCNLNEAMTIKDDFDLVGVSFHSFSVRYAKQIRDRFKRHLICGGHHVTALPDQMIQLGYDQLVIGEGENAILSIIEGNRDKVINSKDWDHKYFSDINKIPFPDYTGLDFQNEMGIPIISSRGCPFACNFCGSVNFWHRNYQIRSAENVLAEIFQRRSEGFTNFMFEDDNFTVNRHRIYQICSQLDGELKWNCASRAESLDEDLCHELYEAGCRTIWLGVESFSQESLDRCNKHTTVEKMVTGIKTAEHFGLSTVCQFIIGLPGDTEKDIIETRNMIQRNQIKGSCSNIAWILPGTEIHRQAKSRGFDDSIYLQSGAPFYTYEQNINTLNYWSNLIITA